MKYLICAMLLWAPAALAVDLMPAFELQDLDGSTAHFSGTVGTSAIALPTVAGNIISEVVIKCPFQTPVTKTLKVSFDGGTSFFTLDPGEFIGWSAKGSLRQIYIKGGVAGVTYDILLNREGY